MTKKRVFANIFDFATNWSTRLQPAEAEVLQRILDIRVVDARVVQGQELSDRYNICPDQEIVTISNRVFLEQVFYNKQRHLKPQNFKSDNDDGLDDPTVGKGCDFCDPQTWTASETWGRYENEYAVSASNLFKYCSRHGLVILKSHDPFKFSHEQFRGMLDCAGTWFERTALEAESSPSADGLVSHPLLIWNTLHRAGASQWHPHMQTMLQGVPFPTQEKIDAMVMRYAFHPGAPSFYRDLTLVHAAASLVREIRVGDQVAYLFPSLCLYKDMEVQVLGQALLCPAFTRALHLGLRALIEELGSRTYNVGILNLSLGGGGGGGGGGDGIGIGALGWTAMGQNAQTSSMSSVTTSPPNIRLTTATTASTGAGQGAPAWLLGRPVLARIFNRGKVSVKSADMAGLEVMGGSSTGHCDPYDVVQAIDDTVDRLFTSTEATIRVLTPDNL